MTKLQLRCVKDYSNASTPLMFLSPAVRTFVSSGSLLPGIGGSTALIEFGGEPYAHNPAYRGKNVDVMDMLRDGDINDGKVFGAAMADMAAIGGNSGEMISNLDPVGENLSRVARVGSEQQCIVESYPSTLCGPIANLFVSQGLASDLIKVEVKKRTDEQISLTQCIRSSLVPLVENEQHIGLGGVFELAAGRIRSHVMPNYDCLVEGYYDTDKEQVVKDFLQFYEHIGAWFTVFHGALDR